MVTIDIPVPFGTPIDRAQEVLVRVAAEFAEDPAFDADLLDAPEVLGVEQISSTGMTLRMTAKTTTDAQARVGRELRRRVTDALEEAGLNPDPMLLRAATNGGSLPGGPT
jgi:small conductance mechanosensitive channel